MKHYITTLDDGTQLVETFAEPELGAIESFRNFLRAESDLTSKYIGIPVGEFTAQELSSLTSDLTDEQKTLFNNKYKPITEIIYETPTVLVRFFFGILGVDRFRIRSYFVGTTKLVSGVATLLFALLLLLGD